MWPYALSNLRAPGILCPFEVVVSLQVGPKLRRRAKVTGQAQRGVGRYRPLASIAPGMPAALIRSAASRASRIGPR
jgi:hypothetical protein